jgi:hypothetical protein
VSRSDDEFELERRAGAGDQQAFDLLYERYLARLSWFFTIFAPRRAGAAVEETLVELFGSLGEPSELSLAERAYRLARATERRHDAAKVRPTKPAVAKAAGATILAARVP